MTIRGGGNPHTAMAAMPLGEWTRRLGALLAEAYDCFMVGTLHGSTEYKRGSRAIARGQWQAPPRVITSQTPPPRQVFCRPLLGQGQAFGGAEEAPSLTLAARDGDGQYAVGGEECSRRGSNKRINKQGREGATKFFFNDTATTEIYTLSLHDALPISWSGPYMVQPNTSVVRGRLLVANGRLHLGSSRLKPPHQGKFSAVLSLVKDKPSAALKKRRP